MKKLLGVNVDTFCNTDQIDHDIDHLHHNQPRFEMLCCAGPVQHRSQPRKHVLQ